MLARYASRRARIAMSIGLEPRSVGSKLSRMSSRSRRLRRFRSTALCWCRGTTMPTRGKARGEARTRTSRCVVRIRFPSRMTVWMSLLRVSRLRRANPKPELGACVLAREFDGQTSTSLLATTAQDFTSPLGFHARAKSVSLNATLVTGAVGWLTHDCSKNGAKERAIASGKPIPHRGIDQEPATLGHRARS
jgi:hypothetical protein